MTGSSSAQSNIESVLTALSRWLACFGGVVLAAIALITVVSIIGRAFVFAGLSPVKGDFELVEAGCAVAVFSFLPWCQLKRGHVTVDILVGQMPFVLQKLAVLFGDLVIALIAFVIAWRMGLGLAEKISYGETTFILGMPVWYGYALGMIGAVLFVAVSLLTVWQSVNAFARKAGRA